MSRTSKKNNRNTGAAGSQSGIASETFLNKKIYSVGIYARLSVDSHGKKNESIETQIEIGRTYIELHPDMVLYNCYSDLGKTGTNFEREGFERLMLDVRQRKVDCIIVKDFSRFGRNYIETGNYIQKIFPFLGVRFISVTDHFDSNFDENDDMGVNLKNLANEMYARDNAIKVKNSKKAKWEAGSYTGGIPPYGYRAEWVDGRKCLFVEAETAEIVRKVYCLYEERKKYREIAEWLYVEKIHRPTEYRNYKHPYWQEGEVLQEWTKGSIKSLLTNPVYMGCMVQAVTSGKDYILRKSEDIDSGDWSVKENTHEAIISEKQFFSIAQRFQKQTIYCNKAGYSKRVPIEEDIFEGILFCGECGKKVGRAASVKELSSKHRIRNYYYYCPNASRIDERRCSSGGIALSTLTDILKTALRQEFILSGMIPKRLVQENQKYAQERKTSVQKACDAVQKKLEQANKAGSEQYLKYRAGTLGREGFLDWKKENAQEIQKLKSCLEAENRRMRVLEAKMEEQNHFIRSLLKFNEKSELDRELMLSLIERINLYSDKRIEVMFRFTRKDISCMGKVGGSNE